MHPATPLPQDSPRGRGASAADIAGPGCDDAKVAQDLPSAEPGCDDDDDDAGETTTDLGVVHRMGEVVPPKPLYAAPPLPKPELATVPKPELKKQDPKLTFVKVYSERLRAAGRDYPFEVSDPDASMARQAVREIQEAEELRVKRKTRRALSKYKEFTRCLMTAQLHEKQKFNVAALAEQLEDTRDNVDYAQTLLDCTETLRESMAELGGDLAELEDDDERPEPAAKTVTHTGCEYVAAGCIALVVLAFAMGGV